MAINVPVSTRELTKKNKPAVYSHNASSDETFEQLNGLILSYFRIQMTAEERAD